MNSKTMKRGILILPIDFLSSQSELVYKVFGAFIPIRAISRMMEMDIVYHGLSYAFDDVEEGAIAPLYKVVVEKDETFWFERVDGELDDSMRQYGPLLEFR